MALSTETLRTLSMAAQWLAIGFAIVASIFGGLRVVVDRELRLRADRQQQILLQQVHEAEQQQRVLQEKLRGRSLTVEQAEGFVNRLRNTHGSIQVLSLGGDSDQEIHDYAAQISSLIHESGGWAMAFSNFTLIGGGPPQTGLSFVIIPGKPTPPFLPILQSAFHHVGIDVDVRPMPVPWAGMVKSQFDLVLMVGPKPPWKPAP